MNLYIILGVSKESTFEEIKKAYRELSKMYHPDVGGDEAKFIEINFAYKILSNSSKRKQYDTDGYIEPDESMFRQQVVNKIAVIIDIWVKQVVEKGNNISIIRFFNAQIKNARTDMEGKLDQVKRSLRFMKTSSEQLVYKGDSDSLMHQIIQSKIASAKSIKRQLKDELRLVEGVTEELQKYIMDEPSEIENTVNMANGTIIRFFTET